MHSGIAIQNGRIALAHPAEPVLLFYGPDGRRAGAVAVESLLELHGFCVVGDGMWIGDVGFKRRVRGADFEQEPGNARVVLIDAGGRIHRELAAPTPDWSPTAVAVVEESGELWVADGYGQNLVYRFDADGRHIQTLTGDEGAGRFDCPHGVIVDRRRSEPELYISDRANGRIQVYDTDGRFRRVVGEGIVVTPTDMAVVGDHLALTDFTQARVTVLDAGDQLVEHVGENAAAPTATDGRTRAMPAAT
jgi:DNA-binding beta-propeller fold protein YncE